MTCVGVLSGVMVGYSIEGIGVIPGDTESRGLQLNHPPNRDQVAGYSGSSGGPEEGAP